MTTEQQQFGALPPAQPKKKSGCMIIGLVALAALGGCAGLAFWGFNLVLELRSETTQAMTKYFSALDGDQWGSVYDQFTTSEFQTNVSKDQWLGMKALYNDKLGKFASLDNANFNASNVNGVKTATASYNARFEKGQATIAVKLRWEGGAWKVMEMKVDSPQLQAVSLSPASPEDQSIAICPHCGKNVPANSKFCPECGKAAGPEAEKTEAPAAPEAAKTEAIAAHGSQ
ncbi:MAG: zinc ribbon domain-containing protein [Planctomycetes bacterium]|nr:zinc ribbon domain-containing protein [Planctomycetota bacterium]